MESLEAMMPREKMQRYGIESLSDTELLALFLRTGTREKNVMRYSHDLLRHFGSLYGLLSASEKEIIQVDGIGLAKFAQLKGIAELARRYFSLRVLEEDLLLSPEMTLEFLQSQLADEEREIFLVIFVSEDFCAGAGNAELCCRLCRSCFVRL